MILFFDIDSTLVENRFSRRALGEVLEEIAPFSGKSVRELAREIGIENERRQQTDPDHPLTMDWDDILLSIAMRYGVSLTKHGIDLWNAYAHADEVDVIDDAPLVLSELKQMGHTLVIATKGLWKYQEPVLRVTGLLPFFDDILTPDLTGYLKTSPAYFNKYTVNGTSGMVHIGDHYYDDVICARRNGFISIMRASTPELQNMLRPFDAFERPNHVLQYAEFIPTFPKTNTTVLPNAIVVSLRELPKIVKKLENQIR